MANDKKRYINTRFWNDTYISELDPIEKLLFIYFLTNSHTNISGIYELPKKIIAIETGIDASMIDKIMPRLSDKVRYIDGYVVIKKFLKHQETESHLTKKGIISCLQDLDRDFLENLIVEGFYDISDEIAEGAYKGLQGARRGSNYLDSNLDSIDTAKADSKPKKKKATSTPSEEKIWNYQDELQTLKASPRKIDKIIHLYLTKKNLNFKNKAQYLTEYRRNLKVAKQLADGEYSGKQVFTTMQYCEKEYGPPMWTLDTVLKRINLVTNKASP